MEPIISEAYEIFIKDILSGKSPSKIKCLLEIERPMVNKQLDSIDYKITHSNWGLIKDEVIKLYHRIKILGHESKLDLLIKKRIAKEGLHSKQPKFKLMKGTNRHSIVVVGSKAIGKDKRKPKKLRKSKKIGQKDKMIEAENSKILKKLANQTLADLAKNIGTVASVLIKIFQLSSDDRLQIIRFETLMREKDYILDRYCKQLKRLNKERDLFEPKGKFTTVSRIRDIKNPRDHRENIFEKIKRGAINTKPIYIAKKN